MLDPVSIGLALSGIQKAVKMVKQASQTVDDVASLGPVLGRYFTAKDVAVKTVTAAKASGNASNMGAAIEIEMALEQTRQFESELQMLFMQAGKVDVWNKIKERAGEMDKADKFAEQAAKDRAKKQKEEQEEFFIIAAVIVLVVVLGYVGFLFVQESVDYAKKNSHPVHHHKS
jgi:altronate dehydratase